MQTPIYKCPDCGAKVIYNEKKNSWKCAKCGQEFSEYDVFIQGLEEWKAEVASRVEPADTNPQRPVEVDTPKVSEPSAEPVDVSDCEALLNDFMKDNEASIKGSENLRNFGFLLPLIVAVALWFANKGIMLPIVIFVGGIFLVLAIGKGIYRGLAQKMKKYFSEIKDINDMGIICKTESYCRYLKENGVEFGKTGDNYKCNIDGKPVCFNDYTLGRWVGSKSKSFAPMYYGQGVRVMHKLNLDYYVVIFKLPFPSVACKFQVSGADYLNDEAFAQYKVRTWNMRSLSEWKIKDLKTVLKNIETIVSDKYHCSFELVFERHYITLIFRPGFSAFCAGFEEKSDMNRRTAERDFQLICDLMRLSHILASIEIEEEPDAETVDYPLDDSGVSTKPNMDFINKKPSWVGNK